MRQQAEFLSHTAQYAGKGVAQTTRKTLALNAILSFFKILLGWIGKSQALVADGTHSLSDCITDIGILLGVRYWSAPADERHPYGHWRLESIVTIAMGLSLLGIAGGLILRAIQSMGTSASIVPAWYTLITAIFTLASKEAMYHWTKHKATIYQSRALLANAWHQRSDAISSIPAVIAISAAMIFSHIPYIDPVGAIVVSLFILKAAIETLKGAVEELMDESLPLEKQEQVESVVCGLPDVTSMHALRSRRNGPGYFIDIHVQVPPDLSVREGHNIARDVRRALMEGNFNILDAIVHIEPDDE